MNAGELFNSIATAGGIAGAEAIKTFLANPELSKIEIPSDLADVYQNYYMTEETAKSNSKIQKHFRHETLSIVDQKIEAGMDALGFSDEQKEAVKKIESTFKRQDKFNEIAKGITSSSTSESDKKKFKEAIEKLNSELSGKDTKHLEELNKINNVWAEKLKAKTLRQKFLEKPLFTSDTQTIDDTLLLAENKLLRHLADKKAALIFNPETEDFKIVQADNKELAYTENHKEVSFNDIRDKVLADSKLLKVTNSTTSRIPGNTQHGGEEKPPSLRDVKFNQNADSDLANLVNAPAAQ